MIVTKWYFHLSNANSAPAHFTSKKYFGCIQKKHAIKKGIACSLNCQFVNGEQPILEYSAGLLYLIDFLLILLTGINWCGCYETAFQILTANSTLKKWEPVLQNENLLAMYESIIDLQDILRLLK